MLLWAEAPTLCPSGLSRRVEIDPPGRQLSRRKRDWAAEGQALRQQVSRASPDSACLPAVSQLPAPPHRRRVRQPPWPAWVGVKLRGSSVRAKY